MKRILRLDVSGIPFFRKASLDLDHPGLIVLLGANKDGDVGGNAAGKSLLARQLPEIILGTSLSSRRDGSRQGNRAFDVRVGKKTYRIEQSFSPRETIKVLQDGADLGYHTLDESRAAVSAILSDMGDAEVRSLLYLDSNRPHPLIKGDSADRKKFFTQFFRLHAASAIKKMLAEELRGLTRAEGSKAEIEEQLKGTEYTDPEYLDVLSGRIDKLKSKQAKVTEQIAKRARVEALRESWSDAQPVLSKLRKEFEVKSAEDLDRMLATLTDRTVKLKGRLAEFSAYRNALEVYDSSRASLKDVRAEITSVCTEFPEFTGLSWDDLTDWLTEASGQLEARQDAAKKRARLVERHDDACAQVKELEARIAHLSTETAVCPTCGGPHDNVSARSKLKDARARLREVKAEQQALDEELSAIKVRPTDKLEARVNTARSLRKLVKIVEKSSTDEPPTPPRWDEAATQTEYQQVGDSLKTLVAVDRTVFRTREAWKSLPEELKSLLESDPPDADGLADKIATLSDELRTARHNNEQHLALKARLAQVDGRLSDKAPLELLEQAFSRDGVESLQIRALCARLETQIQKLAPLLFPEDYRFEFDLSKHFDIIVHRNYKGKTIQSDVRLLSGSETRMFSLLLFMGLTVFIPKNKRLSLLILDEPESAMSPQYLERFMAFLPVLNSVVPTILIVTPQSPDLYASLNPKFVTVVKKNGRSSLVDGVVQ
jgi:DNA repair exonuclease SbcCD ATPase subunit